MSNPAEHADESSQDGSLKDREDNTEELIATLVEGRSAANKDLVASMLRTVLNIDVDNVDRLEMKIADRALQEMTHSWSVFSPYHDVPKVTIFGSARTAPEAADYQLAKAFGAKIADSGWMVMTGAGPGIMTAGIEGAGRDMSFGINIDLPFEAAATELIRGDHKVIDFKYFFTRKLSFVKEAAAVVLCPGGFGTMDEGFELLTLMQTGKTFPAPVVLLDAEGSTYWQSWIEFIKAELLDGGLISSADLSLFRHTHDADQAVTWIQEFFRNYHSIRFVGKRLVIRVWRAPSDEQLAALTEEFSDIIVDGAIESIEVTRAERRDDDVVDLDRIAFEFNRHGHARLHEMIWKINELDAINTGAAADTHHSRGASIPAQPNDTEVPDES